MKQDTRNKKQTKKKNLNKRNKVREPINKKIKRENIKLL